MADAFSSFDAQAAADPTFGGLVPAEKPAEEQVFGHAWPTPADLVSDHGSEGAPYLPAARGYPEDPPIGPMWRANHDGPSVPYSAAASGSPGNLGPQPASHAGTDAKPQLQRVNIGQPFTVKVTRFIRHLATNVFGPTGQIINPPDAPSAEVQIYGSQHDTRPRWIGYDVSPLWDNVASSAGFSEKPPTDYGVADGVPDLAQRQRGAVSATLPDDPYVASSAPAAAAGAVPAAVNYDYLGTGY